VPAEYYERLGVDRDASESEIRSAFRERIKETHPDVSDDEAASKRTKRLIEAKDVLTDPTKRERYDRLGHETYVSDQNAGAPGEPRTDPDGSTVSDGQQTRDRNRAETGQNSTKTGATDRGETGRTARENRDTNWYDPSRRQRSTASTKGGHRAWDADRSYTIDDSPGRSSLRELLTSQRTIALLGMTFVIYPVLLFGALFRPFPTAVNLTVAMCIVLVIAFLQSVPQVGILVFGIWSVLLPVILFGFVGVSVLSLQGVLALAAVGFPLGLSVLTWIALGPMKR
jgi:molecular chaperone DnaJ